MRWQLWAGVPLAALACSVVGEAAGPSGGDGGGPRRRAAPLKVGDEVADFELEDVDDNSVKLSDAKGKQIVVLEFGACT